jgi:hypothetical protein
MFAATPEYAREAIHAFNEQGFAALDPKWSGGRPRRFGPVVREIVCRVAKTSPQQLGRPFTTWSLSELVEHLGTPSDRHQHRDGARDPARGRHQLAGHQDLEGQPGPGLHREDGPDLGPVCRFSNVANLAITLWPGMKIGQLCPFLLSSPTERSYGRRGRSPFRRSPVISTGTSTPRAHVLTCIDPREVAAGSPIWRDAPDSRGSGRSCTTY